jgi:hypothetical protein
MIIKYQLLVYLAQTPTYAIWHNVFDPICENVIQAVGTYNTPKEQDPLPYRVVVQSDVLLPDRGGRS